MADYQNRGPGGRLIIYSDNKIALAKDFDNDAGPEHVGLGLVEFLQGAGIYATTRLAEGLKNIRPINTDEAKAIMYAEAWARDRFNPLVNTDLVPPAEDLEWLNETAVAAGFPTLVTFGDLTRHMLSTIVRSEAGDRLPLAVSDAATALFQAHRDSADNVPALSAALEKAGVPVDALRLEYYFWTLDLDNETLYMYHWYIPSRPDWPVHAYAYTTEDLYAFAHADDFFVHGVPDTKFPYPSFPPVEAWASMRTAIDSQVAGMEFGGEAARKRYESAWLHAALKNAELEALGFDVRIDMPTPDEVEKRYERMFPTGDVQPLQRLREDEDEAARLMERYGLEAEVDKVDDKVATQQQEDLDLDWAFEAVSDSDPEPTVEPRAEPQMASIQKQQKQQPKQAAQHTNQPQQPKPTTTAAATTTTLLPPGRATPEPPQAGAHMLKTTTTPPPTIKRPQKRKRGGGVPREGLRRSKRVAAKR